jgi:hypothetical protein
MTDPAVLAKQAELDALQTAFDDYIASSRELEEELDAELTKCQQDLDQADEEESSRMNGRGTKTYANGDVYEGNWEDDKKQGKGKYTFANGAVYVGNWKDDERHGEGKATCANGAVYVGNWKDDKMQGKWKHTYAKFINGFRMKCQSTIYNETDKAVHAIVTSNIIGTTTTNTASANIGGNSLGSAGGTHTNQNNMGPTPPQMSPIPARQYRRFNLDSSDYYLTYYTIASGRNVYHEVNVKVEGKNDYVIEPEYLENHVTLSEGDQRILSLVINHA